MQEPTYQRAQALVARYGHTRVAREVVRRVRAEIATELPDAATLDEALALPAVLETAALVHSVRTAGADDGELRPRWEDETVAALEARLEGGAGG